MASYGDLTDGKWQYDRYQVTYNNGNHTIPLNLSSLPIQFHVP